MRTEYICHVDDGTGAGVRWTVYSLHRAERETKARVRAGYQDRERGTITESTPGLGAEPWVCRRYRNVRGRVVSDPCYF